MATGQNINMRIDDQTLEYQAGFRVALDLVERYDKERTRLARVLTDNEIRQLAEWYCSPIMFINGTAEPVQ